jgi:hypothetical protein
MAGLLATSSGVFHPNSFTGLSAIPSAITKIALELIVTLSYHLSVGVKIIMHGQARTFYQENV